MRILVVEDEALVAMTIEALLIEEGFEVVACVDTGAAAVEACGRLRPQVVVMDINLKGAMDGLEAAAIIRRTCAASIVFLTGQGDTATRRRALAIESAAYLLKPFLADELLATVASSGQQRSSKAPQS